MSTIPKELRNKLVEIHQTKDGRIFGFTDFNVEVKKDKVVWSAKIAGDMDAGNDYLKALGKEVVNHFLKHWGYKTVNIK